MVVCGPKVGLRVDLIGLLPAALLSLSVSLHPSRRLDRIRREMSEESVSRVPPDPDSSLPSTPPPWTMEPPPSYDTVMKNQQPVEQL